MKHSYQQCCPLSFLKEDSASQIHHEVRHAQVGHLARGLLPLLGFEVVT